METCLRQNVAGLLKVVRKLLHGKKARIISFSQSRKFVENKLSGKSCGGGCIKGLCVLFCVLLVLLVMAGVAIYIDPGENTDIVGEGHEITAMNVTSVAVDGLEVVKEEKNVTNPTVPAPVEVNGLNVSLTSEQPSIESDLENTDSADQKNLESWSSSMASGKLNKSTRSTNSNSNSNTIINSDSAE